MNLHSCKICANIILLIMNDERKYVNEKVKKIRIMIDNKQIYIYYTSRANLRINCAI